MIECYLSLGMLFGLSGQIAPTTLSEPWVDRRGVSGGVGGKWAALE